MKTIVETLQKTKECGLGTCQIFMGNPMSYNIRSLKNEKWSILEYQSENPNSHFVVHAPYLINLASDNTSTKERSRGCLHNMLRELEHINCSVVLHTGAKGSLSDVADQLNTMLDVRGAPPVLLENSDGAGTKLGKNYDELRRIAECVDRSFKLGFCIDTAHLYTSGECEFERDGQGEDVVEFLTDYRHRLIHLNDSQTAFSSHRDKHGSIGQGYIWKADQRSLGTLVHGAMAENIPVILETPTALTDINYIGNIMCGL
jgi:deoxyribonuclease-4